MADDLGIIHVEVINYSNFAELLGYESDVNLSPINQTGQ